MNGITLTYEQAGKLDDLFSAIRWALDPDLQLTIANKAMVKRLISEDGDLENVLKQTDALNQEIIHPWLQSNEAQKKTGYLGNINGPGCDPDTI